MGSCTHPIQTVWDPVEIRYRLYGNLYISDTDCIDPIQIRYRLYRILYISDTDCIGSYTDPIQTVWDPIEIGYRLYGIV
eukprot:5115909-Pyramimonas_sp.AAC.1